MGVVEFFVFVLIVAVLGAVTVFLLRKFAPGHPNYLDGVVWAVVILVIVVALAQALGLTAYDPQIPRLR